ncbi:Protein SHOOT GRAVITROPISM 5 [Zea mays]|uniref:Protein SHOOT GRAVITROPISM 5 n=2 Tax=Zea mays TaxID=4577 RepID=A0A1D6ERC9_MAIZE|nr:Protein SHOOT GRAVITROPISM 5 [Zea mays]
MLGFCAPSACSPPDEATPEPFRSLQIATTVAAAAATTKKKRRPAGTPDPDAEVVSLSPRTLLESDRYVCEICGQGFQRDQNLQMHRRRHKVPWKLLKREAGEAARKRVFVCPEPSCLHHHPSHALGDLVGIKKHFRRKHSGQRQWACARCSKAYAVHSDYKAHLKTCGTRGHSCDCGRVFSRVESFIEHQDSCNAGQARAGAGVAAASAGSQQQAPPAMSLSRTASSTSPSSDIAISPVAAWPAGPAPAIPSPASTAAFHWFEQVPSPRTPPPSVHHRGGHNLELQLMPPSCSGAGGDAPPRTPAAPSQSHAAAMAMQLQLSIGVCGDAGDEVLAAAREEEAREQLRQAVAEKAAADEARAQAKRQAELAERELASAKRMRRQAQVELSRAHAVRDHALRQVNATLLQITCLGCRHKFHARPQLDAVPARWPAAAATCPPS